MCNGLKSYPPFPSVNLRVLGGEKAGRFARGSFVHEKTLRLREGFVGAKGSLMRGASGLRWGGHAGDLFTADGHRDARSLEVALDGLIAPADVLREAGFTNDEIGRLTKSA